MPRIRRRPSIVRLVNRKSVPCVFRSMSVGPDSAEASLIEPTAESFLESAFQRHYGHLRRLAGRLMEDAEGADDLVQETFVRAARRLEDVEEAAQASYLRKTLVNLWRNWLRRRQLERRARTSLTPTVPMIQEAVDPNLVAVWIAVKKLPDRQRLCMVLRYSFDLSEQQMAEVLGCSVGSIKKQSHRALVTLRRELQDES